VTPASGGNVISADTVGGAYTSLTGPAYKEAKVGAVKVGTIILNAPAGFAFDTGGVAPTVKITGNAKSSLNINAAVSGTALAMTSVTATQLTFTVTAASASKGTPNTMTWENVRVRPAAGTPLASGVMLKTGTSAMTGVATNTSFGFLAEAAGAASILVLQTPPSYIATAGVPFAQQPAVQIQDQFGNARTYANRDADNSTVVTAALATGTGSLQGTPTATAADGLAAFSDLSYDKGETRITIEFTSGSLTSAISGEIAVSRAPSGNVALSAAPAAQQDDAGRVDGTVELISAPLVIKNLARRPDGSVEITAAGVPLQTHRLQACEKLGDWATIGTNDADANGIIVFLDQNAAHYASRFYRLATP
jgi:hypothetical protein